MKIGRVVLSATCIALMSLRAEAAIDCRGKVQGILLYADGSVNLLGAWRGDWTYVCNTNGTFGGVSAEICLVWYATALKARADDANVGVYYNTSSHTCATLPIYGSALVPVYIGSVQ